MNKEVIMRALKDQYIKDMSEANLYARDEFKGTKCKVIANKDGQMHITVENEYGDAISGLLALVLLDCPVEKVKGSEILTFSSRNGERYIQRRFINDTSKL